MVRDDLKERKMWGYKVSVANKTRKRQKEEPKKLTNIHTLVRKIVQDVIWCENVYKNSCSTDYAT